SPTETVFLSTSYMGIKNQHVINMVLLQWVYDHYVHYYMAGIYAKGKKEKVKHTQDELKKSIPGCCQRLCKEQYKFAINNGFPKHYINILKDIKAHSNDEYNSKKDAYLFKHLPYCSEAANTLMCRLDNVMKKAFKKTPGTPQPFLQTLFPKAPTGLPIDFYDHELFNNLLPSQKLNISDSNTLIQMRRTILATIILMKLIMEELLTWITLVIMIKRERMTKRSEEDTKEEEIFQGKGKGKECEIGQDEEMEGQVESLAIEQSTKVSALMSSQTQSCS
ncbi:hypothetical protein VP01_5441g1, partial [Puccinia sorghi]